MMRIHGIQVSSRYAYVAVFLEGLRIIDISTPERPSPVGAHSTSSTARSVALSGAYACVAVEDTGLEEVDVSDPTSPRCVACNSAFDAYRFRVASGKMFVEAGDNELAILNKFRMLRFGPASVEVDSWIRPPIRGACGQSVKLLRSKSLVDWEDSRMMTLERKGCGLIDSTAEAPSHFCRVVEDKP